MWIEGKYSEEVQNILDELNKAIADVYEDIQNKSVSSFSLTYEQSQQLKCEYFERIKPFQDMIAYIIIHSPKTMIIHDVEE